LKGIADSVVGVGVGAGGDDGLGELGTGVVGEGVGVAGGDAVEEVVGVREERGKRREEREGGGHAVADGGDEAATVGVAEEGAGKADG